MCSKSQGFYGLNSTLSPAAQAVLDAYEESNDCYREEWGQLAAAFRAVADQVVPSVPFDRRYTTEDRWNARDDIRAEILAIADQLEGAA